MPNAKLFTPCDELLWPERNIVRCNDFRNIMCCEHLIKVCNDCGCWTWAGDVDLWILWCFINSDKKILSGWKWATLVNMDGVSYLFWWIYHLEGFLGSVGPTTWQPWHSRTYLSAWISIPGHQTLCLRCCLTLVMPWWPSCANWRMQGRSASGITIRLFRRIIPRFWQSSSFRSAKGFGAAAQFPFWCFLK